MQSLCRSLTTLVALSISFSTSVAHPRHDGRNHEHKHAPRQGAFAGIQMISSSSGPSSTDLLPPDVIVPGSAINAAPIPAPMTDSSSKTTNAMLANTTTRAFPIRVIQIPVATICPASHWTPLPAPYTTSTISATSLTQSTSSAHALLNSTSPSTNATDYIPIPANTSIVAPTVTLADPSARIILGDNGCQTLFTPITTAICSTVLSIGGQLPIRVTDCGQWVTFSSSPVCDGPGGAATTALASSSESVAYFLAPWYEIASGAVPAEVQVQTCSSASETSNCATGSESWSISTTTVQSAMVQTAHVHGGAVGPLNLTLLPNFLTISISSTTTTLSIDTTITHFSPHPVPTIVRLRQDHLGTTSGPTTTSTAENTITTTIPVPITKTYRVEVITHHTTVTVTVEETATSLVVVGASSVAATHPV